MKDTDPNRAAALQEVTDKAIGCIFDLTERTNAQRVREAAVVLDLFGALTGVDPHPDHDGPETALCDLLAHLMHYADAHGLDFTECVYLAAGYHFDEVSEEAGPDAPDLAERHEAEQAEVTREWEERHGRT